MDGNWSYHIGLRSPNLTNTTVQLQENFEIDLEDTNWILTSSFIIFTMQTGFGMLESGCVSIKNEANIMMKNLADISLGGLTYWIFGYGMSFGEGPLSNSFIGVGNFLVDPPVGDPLMGPVFASFLFQLSFATTATTIVSGAMAERCNFKAYCLFSFLNTIVYCVPAGWVWGKHGFLNKLGAVDIAGSGPVHLVGGASAFASALMLGPRLGRYARGTAPLPLGNPVNAVMGTFVLWWGWLAFNSGSTYGVSGAKWQYAARAAVMTMMGSFGGGCFGLLYSLIKNKGRADVMELINSILGSLVSITAGCFLFRAWESLVIGMIGAAIASAAAPMFDKMKVDDPVGASAVHGACGLWGVIAVGLFADNPIPMDTTNGRSGLFKGGGWYLLGVQSLTALCLASWAALVTMALLWLIDLVLPIRMEPYEELLGADLTEHRIRHGQVRSIATTGLCLASWAALVTMALLWLIDLVLPIRMEPYEELLGADLTEHRIRHGQVGISRAVSALRPYQRSSSIERVGNVGVNTGHSLVVDKLQEIQKMPKNKFGDNLQMFTNTAFVDETERSALKNKGFLNKRPGNPQNDLHRAIDSIAIEINGQLKQSCSTTEQCKVGMERHHSLLHDTHNKVEISTPVLEELKGVKWKELSASQLEMLDGMVAGEDRFRHRHDYTDADRRSAVTANIRWID
ncbi:putative ammonium transporter 2 isoform X2 [Maniola hyperantus]|uniref:putative ammonium transporter 2 isoform X2 n=1 Tax=Aphantopus hyperantus TaxID=2795564 RepID=UPI0037490A2A